MMENLLVLGTVLVAAVCVGRRMWRNLRGGQPACCGGCSGCPPDGMQRCHHRASAERSI